MPDYDEYYSLKGYSERFISDSDEVIKIFFSKPTTLNQITLWEEKNENDAFIKDRMTEFHERAMEGEEFEVSFLISSLNLKSLFIEKGDVFAHIDIYNAFVSFLTENKINT